MRPIEGRGVRRPLAFAAGSLTVHSSTQQPHIVRSASPSAWASDEGQIRVVSPDVGGGFGYKGILLPRGGGAGLGARRIGAPLRWIEDRRESSPPTPTAASTTTSSPPTPTRDGRLLALDCEATVDSGAYSAYPFSACLEAGQVASILPGPYDFPHYRCRSYSVATNKPPILPYRGVARTGVCFALEASRSTRSRAQARHRAQRAAAAKAWCAPSRCRSTTSPSAISIPATIPKPCAAPSTAIGLAAVRAAPAAGEPRRPSLGVGFAMYSEQAGHGTSVYAAWGIPFVPGHEQALARFTPDGGSGDPDRRPFSHGQGLETTLSQVAHAILGVPHERIRLVHGDTRRDARSRPAPGARAA